MNKIKLVFFVLRRVDVRLDNDLLVVLLVEVFLRLFFVVAIGTPPFCDIDWTGYFKATHRRQPQEEYMMISARDGISLFSCFRRPLRR